MADQLARQIGRQTELVTSGSRERSRRNRRRAMLARPARCLYKPPLAPNPTPLEAGRFNSRDVRHGGDEAARGRGAQRDRQGGRPFCRREGRVPGVIYGGGGAPEPISVDYKELHKLVYAGHFLTSIFELEVAGRKERVLPRDYQLDVVTDVRRMSISSASSGIAGAHPHAGPRDQSGPFAGRQEGGAVNLVLHALELWAPADAIPNGHHRSCRSGLSRFGSPLEGQAARGLQARRDQDRLHGRHYRAADRLPDETPAAAAPVTSGAPSPPLRPPPPRPRQGSARRSGQRRARGPAKAAAAAPAKAPAAKK